MKLKKFSLSVLAILTIVAMLTACGGKTSQGTANDTKEAADTESKGNVEYPITINHAFGQTVIKSQPKNVVTIAWGNQDVPLALGVIPTGVSKANFGSVGEKGLLPWTEEQYKKLGVEKPVVFDDTDGLDYEAISDAKPDVILAAYSGITQEEYDLLSQIAPVVAYPKHPWQTYWREQTLMDAKAIGKESEAKDLVKNVENLIQTKTSKLDALKGKTGAFVYFNASDLGKFYVYLPTDPRASYLPDLGLKFPESVSAMSQDENDFTVTVSAENIDALKDIDVIVTYGDDSVLKTLQADPLVGKIPAIANGAVVMLDSNSAIAAASTPSILSIPATVDEYLGLLNEAAKKVK